MPVQRVAICMKILYYQNAIDRLDREHMDIELGRAECRLLSSLVVARRGVRRRLAKPRRSGGSWRHRLRLIETRPGTF